MAKKMKKPKPRKPARAMKSKSPAAAARAVGRKAEVLAMLKRPGGATAAQIMAQTGMLRHSARSLVSQLGVNVKKAKDVAGNLVYSA